MKKFLAYSFIGLGFAAASGTALAISQICVSATQVGIPACAGNAACIAGIQANHPECFGTSSSTAASSQAIYSTAGQQFQAISNTVGNRFAPRSARNLKAASSGHLSGLAAGSPASQWNVWASANADNNKYDRGNYTDAAGATRNNVYNINVTNVVIGADYQLAADKAVGLSLAFDNSSGSGESFLAGASQGITAQSANGYTAAPYFGWQINQDWALDAALGIGKVNTNVDGITGKADRLFMGANLGYTSWMDQWQLTGKGSFLFAEEKNGDLTNTLGAVMTGTAVTNKISQLRFGAQANYWVNDNTAPYFGLALSTDSRSSSASSAALVGKELGSSALLWSLGVNFFSTQNNLTGGISYNQETGRTYAKNNSVMANINYRF